MWKNTDVYPLLSLAVFSAVVLLLVHTGQNRTIDTCITGSITARNQARIPATLVDTYLDARRMQFGLGSIAIGEWQGLGDGMVAGGQAWLRTTHPASPQYYALVANRYFQSLFLVYVPTGARPVSTLRVEPGTSVTQLWQTLADRFPAGVILEGYAHLRPLHTIAIAQPAMDGKPLGGNTPYYYTQPMESQPDAWVYAIGYVHDSRQPPSRQGAETGLLFPVSPLTGGLTHVLTLQRAPLDPALPPSVINSANVGQLLGASEFIEGEFRLFPIRNIGSCVDALVRR
jgi:hypothetical protein